MNVLFARRDKTPARLLCWIVVHIAFVHSFSLERSLSQNQVSTSVSADEYDQEGALLCFLSKRRYQGAAFLRDNSVFFKAFSTPSVTFVPGITPEEQETGESFHIWDYLD